MSNASQYYKHQAGKPGSKVAKKARAGTLTMQHPGGLVSEAFRDKAKDRHRAAKFNK